MKYLFRGWNLITLKRGNDDIPPIAFAGAALALTTIFLGMCVGAAYGY